MESVHEKNTPTLVFLYGPAGSGKLTIAKELANKTSYKLFHNHLTIDLLLSVFDFGTPLFIKHRERIWLDIIGDAISNGSDLIFTFNPEFTVSPSYIDNLRTLVKDRGGCVKFVKVECPDEEIVLRIESESRKQYKKLWSGDYYLELKEQNVFNYPAHIPTDLVVDSLSLQPVQAAESIVNMLNAVV